jgi:membrane protein required for colicin V production
MTGNALDIVILVILVVTLVLGLIKGLVRQVIGIAAVIAGLVLAARYYDRVAAVFGRAFNSEKWASIAAFAVIFIIVLLVGSLISFLVRKLLPGPLRFADHLFGGVLGLVQGVLISGVIIFALLAFPVNKSLLTESRLAPYCYWLTKAMVRIIPQDLKDQFYQTYREVVEGTGSHGQEI